MVFPCTSPSSSYAKSEAIGTGYPELLEEIINKLNCISVWIVEKFGDDDSFPFELKKLLENPTKLVSKHQNHRNETKIDELDIISEREVKKEEGPPIISLSEPPQDDTFPVVSLGLDENCTDPLCTCSKCCSMDTQSTQLVEFEEDNATASPVFVKVKIQSLTTPAPLPPAPNDYRRCNYCNFKCKTPYQLKLHRRSHTGEKPFACTSCPMTFNRKENLKRHIRTHTGDYPHACDWDPDKCQRRFSELNKLRKHLRTHTGNGTGEKLFACEACGIEFTINEDLTMHSQLYHSKSVKTQKNP